MGHTDVCRRELEVGDGRAIEDIVAKTLGHLPESSEAAGWGFVGKAEDISPAVNGLEDPGVFQNGGLVDGPWSQKWVQIPVLKLLDL